MSGTANTAMFGPITLANPLGSLAVHTGGRPPLVVAAAAYLAAALVAVAPTGRRGQAGSDAGRWDRWRISSGRDRSCNFR